MVDEHGEFHIQGETACKATEVCQLSLSFIVSCYTVWSVKQIRGRMSLDEGYGREEMVLVYVRVCVGTYVYRHAYMHTCTHTKQRTYTHMQWQVQTHTQSYTCLDGHVKTSTHAALQSNEVQSRAMKGSSKCCPFSYIYTTSSDLMRYSLLQASQGGLRGLLWYRASRHRPLW